MANVTREIHGISSGPVGHGGFSDIYTGIWSSPDGPLKVAIKVVRASPNDLVIQKVQRRLEKEMRVWEGLSHANVQKLSGIYDGLGSLPAFVSPWCDNGNIKSFVERRASDPRAEIDKIKLNLLIGVMSGVRFLHDKDIVHGDIKGDNILISDLGAPLLCDFGLARMVAELSESSTQTGPKGTWRWMAPELCLVDGARPSYETDIWACGCLFIEVWSAILPYYTKTNQQQFFLALDAREGPCPTQPLNMPVLVWSYVQRCCDFDPSKRPLASRILQYLELGRKSPRGALRSSIEVGIPVYSVAWLRDGNRVVVGGDGGIIYILNLVTGARIPLVGHTRDVGQVAVSLDGTLLASCSSDGSIILWDAQTGLAIGAPLEGHDGRVLSVAFSPDGRYIASGSGDDTIRVWSIETGTTVLGPLRCYTNAVRSVAYSPDGSRIVSGGDLYGTIQVWDSRTGDLPLSGYTSTVYSAAYSPDGLCIVSGSDDHTVRIWNAVTGQPVGSPFTGHSGLVFSVAYSPDGTRIVSASQDKTIHMWDVPTGASIATFRGHAQQVVSVAFSPHGGRIASASNDGTVRIWDGMDEWMRLDIDI